MKISELIERLELCKYHVGDVECLVGIVVDDVASMAPVEELAWENREGYGPSIALLQ